MSRKAMLWAGCGAMLLAGGYFLWARGHGNLLAYGALLLCPLMHIFMHGSHGHGHHDRGSDAEHRAPDANRPDGESSTKAERPSCH